MNCREAVQAIFQNEDGVLSTQEVVNRIRERFPNETWKDNTISCHLIGLSVNHSSAKHYPSLNQHAFLFSLGNGRYRRYDPNHDGEWKITDEGPVLVDEESEEQIEEDVEETLEASVTFEKDLEGFLVENLDSIEPGLTLYEEEGITGRQFRTDSVGVIDVLAVDQESRYVVIELKVGFADEKVCGQILRYMGWVQENIAQNSATRGIVIASNFKEKLKYAVLAMPSMELKRYHVEFSFSDVSF